MGASKSNLNRMRTIASSSISLELFENPYFFETRAKRKLRKTFGMLTPIIPGFLLGPTLFPLNLMGWWGAEGNGAASTGKFGAPSSIPKHFWRSSRSIFQRLRCARRKP